MERRVEETAEVSAIYNEGNKDKGGIVVSNTVEITIDAEAILEAAEID